MIIVYLILVIVGAGAFGALGGWYARKIELQYAQKAEKDIEEIERILAGE